jgi:glycosyltransferase involved in cell wall biosynthesis
LKAARSVIANSNAIADKCRSAGIPSQRVVTIYNPIDLDIFSNALSSDSASFRQEIGCAASTPLIGIVGQIQEIKGHREFIEAALNVASHEPTAHFAIIGEANGPVDQMFSAEMQAIASNSVHADHIHFTGFRTDVSAVIKALDILVVPSWMEPFGRSVVEGMAAGCAVIGTRAGGIPEIITDGEDGLLIPPRDASALFTAMQHLLHDENLRRSLGRQGKKSASRFSINSHVQKVQALYSSTLQL